MKNKLIYQVVTAAIISFAMFGYAEAQTATTTAPVTEFKKELTKEMNSIAGDTEAKKLQQEIKGDDEEVAGDAHGDAKEIEGENDQNDIDNEVEQEAELEDASSGDSASEGTGSSDTSTSSSEGN